MSPVIYKDYKFVKKDNEDIIKYWDRIALPWICKNCTFLGKKVNSSRKLSEIISDIIKNSSNNGRRSNTLGYKSALGSSYWEGR